MWVYASISSVFVMAFRGRRCPSLSHFVYSLSPFLPPGAAAEPFRSPYRNVATALRHLSCQQAREAAPSTRNLVFVFVRSFKGGELVIVPLIYSELSGGLGCKREAAHDSSAAAE